MKIVGCDLHTRYQQIAMLDEETGELIERRRGAPVPMAHSNRAEGAPVPRRQLGAGCPRSRF